MTRDEIITLASRYIDSDDTINFPLKDDVFCLLTRDISDNKVLNDDEGWMFGGYGICLGYIPDEQAKPIGKWIYMHFATLQTFPPSAQTLKLQPHHIVQGRFQNPNRTKENRILKLDLTPQNSNVEPNNNTETKPESRQKNEFDEKVVQFRKKS